MVTKTEVRSLVTCVCAFYCEGFGIEAEIDNQEEFMVKEGSFALISNRRDVRSSLSDLTCSEAKGDLPGMYSMSMTFAVQVT